MEKSTVPYIGVFVLLRSLERRAYFRGLYIGKCQPMSFGGKNMQRGREKRGLLQDKRKKGERKRKKGENKK